MTTNSLHWLWRMYINEIYIFAQPTTLIQSISKKKLSFFWNLDAGLCLPSRTCTLPKLPLVGCPRSCINPVLFSYNQSSHQPCNPSSITGDKFYIKSSSSMHDTGPSPLGSLQVAAVVVHTASPGRWECKYHHFCYLIGNGKDKNCQKNELDWKILMMAFWCKLKCINAWP